MNQMFLAIGGGMTRPTIKDDRVNDNPDAILPSRKPAWVNPDTIVSHTDVETFAGLTSSSRDIMDPLDLVVEDQEREEESYISGFHPVRRK